MKKIIVLSILIPLIFGFLLFGGGSGGGGFVGIRSANKVYAPTFLQGSFSGSFQFVSRPIFRPTYQPIGPLNAAGAFRWNFFDP